MRVAFISTMAGVPWGGSEELWAATAREAMRCGWQAAFSTYEWTETPAAVKGLIAAGAVWFPRPLRYVSSPAERWRNRLARWIPVTSRFLPKPASPFKAIFAFRPDVICISQGATFDPLHHDVDFQRFLERSALPYVVLSRLNSEDYVPNEFVRQEGAAFLGRAFHVGFAAHRNLKTAERQLAGPIPNASVIQSPINLPDFSSVPWPERVTTPSLACVARLDAACKGQDLLLEALSGREWQGRDWRLCFYGQGPDRSWLEGLVKWFGLTSRVTFAGHVRDIPAIWERSHLLVLPSRHEGTPQAMIQAMVCARPVLVTNVGGTSEWVSEPDTGFIAEAASVSSIARALERAWQARSDWPLIGQAARRAALAKVDKNPQKTLFDLLCTACTRSTKQPEMPHSGIV